MMWYDYYLYVYAILILVGVAVVILNIGKPREPMTNASALVTGILGLTAVAAILSKLSAG